MGNISYALMRKLIYRRITNEVFDCVELYKKKADAVVKSEAGSMEKLLSLSIELDNKCKKIALNILNEYDVEVANDQELKSYKEDLLQNARK